MTQAKIKSKFYPLTPDIGKILRNSNLTAAEWRLWSYLVEVDPFGERYRDFDPIEAQSICNISKATFYRAIAKFQELNLFDFQAVGFQVVNLVGAGSLKNETGSLKNETGSLKNETGSPLKPLSDGNGNHSKNIQIDQISHTPEKREKNQKIKIEENLTNGEEINLKQLDTDTNKEIRTEKGDNKNLGEEKSSAPISPKKKSSQIIEAEAGLTWLPPGPWCINGKLDPQFRDAIAQDWVNRWGGTIHQRRADVLSHLKKDPANLVIRWEQYSSEWLHRYENTQTLMQNGIEIEPDYQQRLIENQRAVTVPIPQDLNPLADTPPIVKAQVKAIASTPDSPQETIPKDCENAQAYQHWQPTPEPAQQADYKAFISNWLQSRKMPNQYNLTR